MTDRVGTNGKRTPASLADVRLGVAIIASVFLAGCQYDPYAHRFTTAQPKEANVSGSYLLAQQTITRDGLSILRGQACELDLRADGSFVSG